MIGTHNGCGHDGWNGAASRTTAGAFCAECPDCPASEEESGTPEEESGGQEDTGDCPDVCKTCEQGWGSAAVDLVNGICVEKCSTSGRCITKKAVDGTDCSSCKGL